MCLAVPGKIESLQRDPHTPLGCTGTVNFAGVRRSVNLTLVPEAQVGDYVLVHVDVALCRIDEAAAQRTLDALATLWEDSGP